MCINFNKNERMFGADATALMARKPQSTFSKLYRMIGKSIDHPVFKELKEQYYPIDAYTNESTGVTTLKAEDTSYTPEELLAMMMEYAKDITKTHVGKDIKDCVITVPSSFTQSERRAVYTAADIANLKILSLIDENTAAALQFGMDRIFNEPNNVLFYNMGANSVQVILLFRLDYLLVIFVCELYLGYYCEI
jgi:hypoxia up-regulated 1